MQVMLYNKMPHFLKRFYLKLTIFCRGRSLKAVAVCSMFIGVFLLFILLPKVIKSAPSPKNGREKSDLHERMNIPLPAAIHRDRSDPQKQTAANMKTVVVDEHHMVLPHWYEVAQVSKLSNFTLIHIDGHIDMGPPAYFEHMFRWPKNFNQIAKFMQRNDVFVVGAMATGLVDSFVWIWPEWTRETAGMEFGEYLEANLDIGYFGFQDKNTKERRGCCVCIIERYSLNEKAIETEEDTAEDLRDGCIFYRDDMDHFYEDLPSKCILMRKSVQLQVMSMTYAIKHGVHPFAKVDRPLPTILDIDEDYWGCERGSDIIEKSGINWTYIDNINKYLQMAILPKTVEQETNLNSILISLVDQSECDHTSGECKLDPSSMVQLKKSGCATKKYKPALTSALKIIKGLSKRQQKIITNVGFCLETSPTTTRVQMGDPNSILVCTGASVPGSTNSVFFTPSLPRVESDMKEVFQLIDKLDFTNLYDLKLITIARSLRDKYTPLDLQQRIEEGILENLKRRFNNPPVKYDKNNLMIYHQF